MNLKNEALMATWGKYRIVFYIIIFLAVLGASFQLLFVLLLKLWQDFHTISKTLWA